jgi:hypothetical protein
MSARARDLRSSADPENRSSSANAQIWRKLSGRDLPRSADHCLRFALLDKAHHDNTDTNVSQNILGPIDEMLEPESESDRRWFVAFEFDAHGGRRGLNGRPRP